MPNFKPGDRVQCRGGIVHDYDYTTVSGHWATVGPRGVWITFHRFVDVLWDKPCKKRHGGYHADAFEFGGGPW